MNPKVLNQLVCGTVGDTHAAAFMATYQGSATGMPTVDEILSDYKNAGKSVRTWKAQKNTANLQACAHAVRTALQDADRCAVIAGDTAMTAALAEFIKDLPADLCKKVRADAKSKGLMK